MKIVFFELENWEIEYFKARIINQEVEYYTTSISETKTDTIYDAEIIASFVFSKLDKNTLRLFPKLKFIATMSTGYDHIDLEECAKKNISVCNVPAYGDNTVAEHVFGLLLNLSRNIHKAYTRTSKGKFTYDGLMGFDLKNKILGVLGTGRIGQNVIRIAKGFNMRVIAYDSFPKYELQQILGFEYKSLEDVLANSDIITIHVPLLESTKHLINNETILKMKPGVVIINTARGAIIDTSALISGLESGKIGGAGLDVLEGELLIKEEKAILSSKNEDAREQMATLFQDYALMRMPNVIVTPHLAFYSKEGVQRILDTTLDNIFDFIENRGLKNKVELKKY